MHLLEVQEVVVVSQLLLGTEHWDLAHGGIDGLDRAMLGLLLLLLRLLPEVQLRLHGRLSHRLGHGTTPAADHLLRQLPQDVRRRGGARNTHGRVVHLRGRASTFSGIFCPESCNILVDGLLGRPGTRPARILLRELCGVVVGGGVLGLCEGGRGNGDAAITELVYGIQLIAGVVIGGGEGVHG